MRFRGRTLAGMWTIPVAVLVTSSASHGQPEQQAASARGAMNLAAWSLELAVAATALFLAVGVLAFLLWRTRRALTRSRQSFDLALRGGDLGLFDWDIPEARVVFNRRWAEMLGYRLEELDTHIRSWEAMIHPDDRARVKRTIENHVRTPQGLRAVELLDGGRHSGASMFEVEYRIRASTDEWKWVRLRGRAFEWSDEDDPVRVVGTHQDVTEQKTAERELRLRLDYEAATAFCARHLLQTDSPERAVDEVLEKLVQTVGVSRAYIFENFESPKHGTCMRQRFEAVAEGISPQIGKQELECVPYGEVFSDMRETLESDRVFQGIVGKMSPEKRAVLDPQGILSIIILPILVQGEPWGFIGFDDCVEERTWRHRDIGVLRTVASLLGGAFERADAARLAGIQRDLSTALSMASDFDAALELCITAALHATQADCAAILLRGPNDALKLAGHEGFSEGFRSTARELSSHGGGVLDSLGAAVLAAEDLPELLRRAAEAEGLTGAAVIPIRDDEDIVACFFVGSHTSASLSSASRDALETIAGQVGGAITRLEAEEALKDSEERHRELVEEINDVIFSLDRNGVVTFVSRALERFSSYNADDVVGHSFREFVHPDDADDFDAALAEALDGTSRSLEFRVIDAGGDLEYVRSSLQPVVTDGRTSGARGAMSNITERVRGEQERQRLLEQLRHGQKMESLGKLAGGVAHHFNNLLQGILGHTSLALEKLSPHSESHESVSAVQRIAQRAANLSSQMLAFSGRGKFVVKTTDLGKFLRETEHILRVTVGGAAELRVIPPPALLRVNVDVSQLRQALVQLVTNAVESISGRGGVVAVSAGTMHCDADFLATVACREDLAENDYIYVDVEDTGKGMDEETRQRAFEPFFSTKHAGRGLGLSTVLGVAAGHRGGVRIDSSPGNGCTVRLLLPTADVARQTHERQQTPGEWRGSGTVLLADDEDVVLAVVEQMLRHMGFDVITARDGSEAVEIIRERENGIRLVVLDLIMPRMGGIEAFRWIRELQPGLPVVVSSGYNEENAEDLPEELASRFLKKPYEIAELRSMLRTILQNT